MDTVFNQIYNNNKHILIKYVSKTFTEKDKDALIIICCKYNMDYNNFIEWFKLSKNIELEMELLYHFRY